MFFQDVPQGPSDPVFGIADAYKADLRPHKVNLVLGIYKNEQLESELLPSVRKAKQEIFSEDQLADYLPIDGEQHFVDKIGYILFGKTFWESDRERIYGAHTVGGTAALRIGAEFTREFVSSSIFVPRPTWPNHRQIFQRAGCQVQEIPYYDPSKRAFAFSSMLSFLEKLPQNSVVLLQGACHNPTGCDPTEEQWSEIARLMQNRKLLPFFDFAYQGFGDGVEKDAGAIRLFAKQGLEFLVAYSCSKNFSLYCQRVGALFAVTGHRDSKQKCASQIKRVIRALYSNPPAHGAEIVTKILAGPLFIDWQNELDAMRKRIETLRKKLVEKLSLKSTGENCFDYLLSHKGMFSYGDMQKLQVQKLIEQYGIYLLESGRINVAGLNSENIDYVVDSLVNVLASDS